MSGYQPVPDHPGYYPQQGYPQQGYGYGQPGYASAPPQYPPGGYPPQSYQPAYQQPAAPAQPVVVNVVNNQSQQQQSYQPVVVPTTVFLGRSYESDVAPALTIFIIGWFCCFVWAAGFRFVRSKNTTARVLGIASVILFFMGLAAIVITIVVTVTAANAIAHNYSTSYTQSVVVSGAGSSTSVYMSSTYSYATVSYSYGTWKASGQSYSTTTSGYSGTYCTQSSCPNQYAPLMELEAKCSGYTSYQTATSGSLYCSGSYIYFVPNLPSTQSGSGSVTVTVTFYT
eukprot:TRINITY_DN213_c1_g1_i1.p1 TRINITY_DN213_c1_g1~~TRINITY_DN213_c1_g1_i1.p1  ORF type:complete len:310 (+),score=110.78 TRINITY_DN213_c1_g1_i1:81-932(+)